MIKVGLTGGYATGKSFVAQEFERLGCHLIYADQLGHEVLLPGAEAYGPVLQVFGEQILNGADAIDRKKLGALVFQSNELLEKLTAIVHPAVFRREESLFSKYSAEDPAGIVIVEAAILVETGRFRNFDRLVVTTCDVETQIARAMRRDGISRQEVLARLQNQLPAHEKLKHAHYVVDTSGSKPETTARVEVIYRELQSLAAETRS